MPGGRVMRTVEFFIPMVPPRTTFQDKQLAVSKGKPIIFDSVELKAVKNSLRDRLGPHAPAVPLQGPVRLMTKWCWPCEGTRHTDGEYKATKPDTDNLVKALKDVMATCGFYTNDALVASEITEKFWASTPGIYVFVAELSEPEQ
jgi:Holliday junction resolvase RusA-like endonuclease